MSRKNIIAVSIFIFILIICIIILLIYQINPVSSYSTGSAAVTNPTGDLNNSAGSTTVTSPIGDPDNSDGSTAASNTTGNSDVTTSNIITTNTKINPDITAGSTAVSTPTINPYKASSKELKEYKAVIENKTKFRNEEGKNVFLDNYIKDNYPNYSIINFTVLDLDGDGVPEVILQLGKYSDYACILHYYNGVVFGNFFSIRCFNTSDLKIDGTYEWSNSASNSGFSKMQFTLDSYKEILLGYTDLKSNDNEDYFDVYYIGGKSVTRDEYFTFFDSKEEVTWCEFSQINLESQLN